MLKSLGVLAIVGMISAPAAAQVAQSAPASNQAQPAKPQMVKKRVCEETNDNPYSRINHSCHTVMVPVTPAQSASNSQQASGTAPQPNPGN